MNCRILAIAAVGALAFAGTEANALPISGLAALPGTITEVQYGGGFGYHRHRGYPGEALDYLHHARPGTYARRYRRVESEEHHRHHHYGY